MRIFSGIQPTGNVHLGNYLGAVRNWVKLQETGESIYSIVDMHAITIWQNPEELYENILNMTATIIAVGIDPNRSIIFNQSSVPEHAELAWIFNCVARIGWLNRMTQFKDKVGKDKEKASVGLYVYPNLMAADILLYNATHVPVGDDQRQHIELARDIAIKFNHDFDIELFNIPEAMFINNLSSRVMSLRDGTKKMSKSDDSDASRINIIDDKDTILKKIRKAKTDSLPLPQDVSELDTRPEIKNLYGLLATINNESIENIIKRHQGELFAPFKEELAEALIIHLAPIQEKFFSIREDKQYLLNVLHEGKIKARNIAEPLFTEVKKKVGFVI